MLQGILKKDIINLDNKRKKQIFDNLKKDSEFLCCQNIMDFSLLLTIEKLNPKEYIK